MRIKTQFVLTMFLFGLVLVAVFISAVITNHMVDNAYKQHQITDNIVKGAGELSYLSNDYVIYREDQQMERWYARFELFTDEVSKLQTDKPDQQVLVSNIKENTQRLKNVFDGVVSDIGNLSSNIDMNLEFLHVSWSRMAVQSLTLISDASYLSQSIINRINRLRTIHITTMFALMGMFGIYLFINYLIMQKRVLKGIANLQAGTAVIGSGDLDFTIEERANDEIGDLSRAFNRMTASLKQVTTSKTELEREIEERKKTSEALKLSESKYKSLFNSMTEGFALHEIIMDSNGKPSDYRFLEINPAFEEFTGLKQSDVTGKRVLEVLPGIESYWIESYGRVALTGEPLHMENYSSALDRWYDVFAYRNTPGQFAVVFTDITIRKQAEKAFKESRDELEQRVKERTVELEQRTKELESFTFVAAHDLQEPLRKIRTFGDLLMQKAKNVLDDKNREYIKRMRESAARMQTLLQSLLEYSGLTANVRPFSPINLKKSVEDALGNLEIQIQEKNAHVEVRSLPVVEADPDRMTQLFQNLIGNALKFQPPGSVPRVKVYALTSESIESTRYKKYDIYIEDNGVGFEDSKYLEKIFQPFQRLHGSEEFEGVGIGLSICRKIIEQHGGSLTAKSTPGKGSIFIIKLPEKQKVMDIA